MKLAAFATTALIALSATAASADQLAQAAGVPSGVYSDNTLAALITAREDGDLTEVAYLLEQTGQDVRISSRGETRDFDSLIASAIEDEDTARVASLRSLANGDNFVGTAGFDRLIANAEQDGDTALVQALKSRAGL